MRTRFARQLALLKQELIEMGALCEKSIELTAKALRGHSTLTGDISGLEMEMDQMERSIESLCLSLLLCEQPVAADLRAVSAALKIITDLERIGDQTSDIADIIAAAGTEDLDLASLDRMAHLTAGMVTLSIDAYIKRSISLARDVISSDDAVDAEFDEAKKMLIERIAVHPDGGELDLDLLMIAKYFERIGDHAVNVAEWVIFAVDGTHKGVGLLDIAKAEP